MSDLADSEQQFTDTYIRMRSDLTREMWKLATVDVVERLCLPDVDDDAVKGLKFGTSRYRHARGSSC